MWGQGCGSVGGPRGRGSVHALAQVVSTASVRGGVNKWGVGCNPNFGRFNPYMDSGMLPCQRHQAVSVGVATFFCCLETTQGSCWASECAADGSLFGVSDPQSEGVVCELGSPWGCPLGLLVWGCAHGGALRARPACETW